jgi:hypothetical protein
VKNIDCQKEKLMYRFESAEGIKIDIPCRRRLNLKISPAASGRAKYKRKYPRSKNTPKAGFGAK